MKYVGSKARLVKYIAPIIQSYIDENNIEKYWEPFVGGGNLITHIKCKERFGSDINPYLIALLKQTQIDASIFPQTVSEAEYKAVQTSKNDYPDWYVGIVGFDSFGGKFFGGYPRGFKNDGITPRDLFNEHYRALIKQAPLLKDIHLSCCDFRETKPIENFVIYCDIPYQNTTKYSNKEAFPYDEFYKWCLEHAKNNIVLISEYSMPKDFTCIWKKEVNTMLDSKGNGKPRTEKLFIVK